MSHYTNYPQCRHHTIARETVPDEARAALAGVVRAVRNAVRVLVTVDGAVVTWVGSLNQSQVLISINVAVTYRMCMRSRNIPKGNPCIHCS